MASEANEPGSESGKRSDAPQEGGASNHLAARLPPRSPGSFAAAAMVTRTASWLAVRRRPVTRGHAAARLARAARRAPRLARRAPRTEIGRAHACTPVTGKTRL